MREPERWDIFCRVVDNFGDAGVCWRLARELAFERGGTVRLWIDNLASLRRLEPAVGELVCQTVAGIEVRHWTGQQVPVERDHAVDVVVEAFGCGLPEAYVSAIAQSGQPPVWIVLEYLSAEAWVAGHHGLPSPHPRWPLQRYFFFPGFVKGTGGLLRERDLFARRDAFGAQERAAFWQSIGQAPPAADALTVSVFAYETAPLPALLQAWETGPAPLVAAVPEGRVLPLVLAHFGARDSPVGGALRRGALEVRIVPFVSQLRYDELLWACDLNVVRGEDSFVRAQWAARPFVWHIYPQHERAHWVKLDAFLDLYCTGLDSGAANAVRNLMRIWNHIESAAVSPPAAWAAFAAQREVLRAHTRGWAARVAGVGELAANLASFCRDKLK